MAVNVVALRAAGVGDLLTAVPALRALSDAMGAGCRLTVAAPSWLHPLIRLIPGVSGAVDVHGLRPLADLTGSLAVNLHGCGPQSHLALLAGRPRGLVAFRSPGRWEAGPEWDGPAQEPERERWCRLLRWMGVDADQTRVEIAKPAEAPPVHSAIVLHVGGKDPRKRLPVEHFVEMFRGLELDTATTVVTGDARDKRAATLLATAAGLPEQNVLAGRLTIQKWAATIANARLVITGDTGAAHLSTAFHVPSVVVFGPESPARWGPPESARHRTLRATGPRPIAGDVSTARVVRAARELLEAS